MVGGIFSHAVPCCISMSNISYAFQKDNTKQTTTKQTKSPKSSSINRRWQKRQYFFAQPHHSSQESTWNNPLIPVLIWAFVLEFCSRGAVKGRSLWLLLWEVLGAAAHGREDDVRGWVAGFGALLGRSRGGGGGGYTGWDWVKVLVLILKNRGLVNSC